MYKSNINLNLYKNFYEVAKSGSITKAAENSYISQSAISKSIKKLESELNVQLFYRETNGVRLTDKGKELLYFVEKSYNNLLIAERNMIEEENLERGKLSIGMPSNVGAFFLFDKIIDFHKKYPNIEITIITGGTAKLLGLLDTHQVDFVIDTSPINVLDGMKKRKLDEVEYSFAVKKDTKICDINKNYTLKDISGYPLILPIPGTDNRKRLDELFKKNKVELKNVLNIHTSEIILSFIKKDLGVGYIIKNLLDDECVPLNIKGLPKSEIDIVYIEDFLTTVPKKFIEMYAL